MSVQVVYKNSKKIANSKIQAIFKWKFCNERNKFFVKARNNEIKKINKSKKFNSDNIFHLNLDKK